MTPTMYDYYRSQPQFMKRILDKRKELFGGFAEFYEKTAPDRVYVYGSGTSFHAGNSAGEFMEMILGAEVSVLAPSQAVSLHGQRPLIIAVSQSGRSTNTLSAISYMREKGAKIASLTGWPRSPVGMAADCSVTLDIEDELVSPKTKGYTATALSLYLMALEAGLLTRAISILEYDRWIRDITASVEASEENQEALRVFYEKHVETLARAKSYLFVGKGVCANVAGEAALKVLETIYCPAVAYEFEEYLHGPIYYMNKDMALFMIVPEDEDKERMIRFCEMVSEVSPNVYLITYDMGLKGANIVNFKDGSYFMTPFSAAFPGQLVSALMPGKLGIVEHPIVRRLFDAMAIKTAPPSQA